MPYVLSVYWLMRLLDKKTVNTYFTHNPFYYCTDFAILILKHNVKYIYNSI